MSVLMGFQESKGAIATAFPNTEYQRCLVHQVRNTLKYVPDKDRKVFAKDLKTIYNAPTEEEGRKALDKVTEKWEEKYPRAMKRWYDNWDAICPIFKFSSEVRTVIYTTNAIESLNATYRKLNRQRSVFPSDQALLKALYHPLLKRPRNGPCHSETGEESMASFRLCMKEDFQNKNMSFSPTWAEAPLCDYLPE